MDNNGDGDYDTGEAVSGASVKVNDVYIGDTVENGTIPLLNIKNTDKIYVEKKWFEEPNAKANKITSNNPYNAVNGKVYCFKMASDKMQYDGSYKDFPYNNTLFDEDKGSGGDSILVQLVHPKFEWNLIVAFERNPGSKLDNIKEGILKAADYLYNYTDGTSLIRNVVFVGNSGR